MIAPWVTILVAIVYVSILFAVATYGDRVLGTPKAARRSKPNIYALSLAVYCTTWTFFGSVGLASTSGLSFLAIYVGPVLAITVGFPLFRRIIQLSKEERITSVADFLGSRYGKNLKVAAVASLIAVIGTIPYIALQLKAISSSVDTLVVEFTNGFPSGQANPRDISLLVAIALAAFAILFGTRHADATEHQHGLMLAIALESVVKLLAFLCVGIFVTWFMFDGVFDLFEKAASNPQTRGLVTQNFEPGNFLVLTCLSLSAFFLLPRQFHVAVVENNSLQELERARWLFPLYLVAINLFVVPIALAGLLRFRAAANADDYVLLLPIFENQKVLALFAFLGGLSAGMAMVVVASVALAIMISNDLVLPTFLRRRARLGQREPENMERNILGIRRTAIFVVLALAYAYYLLADNSAALASIGLVSFAAIAQLAPAFFIGLFWRKGNARGAIFGMITGFVVWGYTLLLPTVLSNQVPFFADGLFGLGFLQPENLFNLGFSPITNGVLWSLGMNTIAYLLGSLSRPLDAQENVQSAIFVADNSIILNPSRIGRSNIEIGELIATLSRYIGPTRTERSLKAYWSKSGSIPSQGAKVDDALLRFSEQLLASSIGASSSRLVHTLLLKRYDDSGNKDYELLDEASRALQFNRGVLQTALDQLDQGITVFDGNYRLASWNRQFRNILDLPEEVGQVGLSISRIALEIVNRNNIDEFDGEGTELVRKLTRPDHPWQLHLPKKKQVLEIRSSPMPEGGIVVTWHNITDKVQAAKALEEANETLEGRVEERTRELEAAKQAADQANASKTRFLAAAGHDILQPLNAARLYSATLYERTAEAENGELAGNINLSLDSVEEILGSILAISRLDSANPEINLSEFSLRSITEQLELEFKPIASQNGLELRFVHSSRWVRSDKALLRRVMQNLISNAIKFTPKGRILVGFRRRGDKLNMEIHDTGIGMTEAQQKNVFVEFTRLNNQDHHAPGLGLGLSIVERICNLLSLAVNIRSTPNKGSCFSVEMSPIRTPDQTSLKAGKTKKLKPGALDGTRILCIDNDPSILQGMRVLLEQWGCEVATGANEAEAKSHLRKQRPDILLIDYHLDETTGVELFAKLQNSTKQTLHAILVTADRSEKVKQMASEIEMPVLNKPVKPGALRAMLSRFSRKT